MRVNLGLLQMREKFAREALMDLPRTATEAERAAAIVDVLAAARADLDRLGGSVSGPVTIAAVASAAATLVSDGVLHLRMWLARWRR